MSVLGRSEIERRLQGATGKEEIFRSGTWSERSLERGAAYDLRVASDYLILPSGRHYWDAGPPEYQRREAPFPLLPGEVAFVSSVEVLCMPDDLAGNVAAQFRRALSGILVMGGLLVDPSYEGRLHFQLANVGVREFEIVPGETSVAAIQLLTVDGDTSLPEKSFPSNEHLLLGLFNEEVKDEPLRPLNFFTLGRDTERLENEHKEGMQIIESMRNEFAVMRQSTYQLILFGVFLVAAALIGASLAAFFTLIAR